jgi:hypothetical protein
MLRRLSIILGYALATLVVVGGTIILIAYGSGYSYDFKSGRLIGDKTPYRQTFEGGSYNFELSRDGYRTWTKQLDAVAARVTLAQYVILMPQRFPVESVATYPSITQTLPSRDRRRVGMVVPSGDNAGVWLLDTQNRNQTRLFPLAPAAAGQPTPTIELMSWSDDASRLLVKRSVGDQFNYLVVSANPNDPAVNVSEIVPGNLPALTFNPANTRELYWVGPEGLRRLDWNARTASGPLATDVAAYTYAGDRVLYVDKGQPVISLWSLGRDGNRRQIATNLTASSAYQIAFSTYVGTSQAVVVAVDSHQVSWYHDIDSDHPTLQTIDSPATQAVFNGDGRFVLLSDDSHVATYDLELNRLNTFPEINRSVNGISWFDNYHLQFNRKGQIVLSEFDGNYAVVVTRGDGLPPFNSTDDKYIYATATTSSGATQIKALKIRQ